MTTTRSVVIEKELPHPPAKVWRALTQGALIKEWLMDNDFQPIVGHKFNFRATPVPNWNGVIDCEVLVVEPDKKLSYSWGSMGLASVVAQGGSRHLVGLRKLIVDEALGQERVDGGQVELDAHPGLENGVNPSAKLLARQPDDNRRPDRGMLIQGGFDFRRIDVRASADD